MKLHLQLKGNNVSCSFVCCLCAFINIFWLIKLGEYKLYSSCAFSSKFLVKGEAVDSRPIRCVCNLLKKKTWILVMSLVGTCQWTLNSNVISILHNNWVESESMCPKLTLTYQWKIKTWFVTWRLKFNLYAVSYCQC